jgi:hypothetical protein
VKTPLKIFSFCLFLISLIGIIYSMQLHGMAIGTTVYISAPSSGSDPSSPPRTPGGGGGGSLPPILSPDSLSPILDGDEQELCQAIFDVNPQVIATVEPNDHVCVRIHNITYIVYAEPQTSHLAYIQLVKREGDERFSYAQELLVEEHHDITNDLTPDITIEVLEINTRTIVRIALYQATAYEDIVEFIQIDNASVIVDRWSGHITDLHQVVILSQTYKVLLKFSDSKVWTLYTREKGDKELPFFSQQGLVQLETSYFMLLAFFLFLLLVSGLGYFHAESLKHPSQE